MTPFTPLELQERIRWYCKARGWYVLAIAIPGLISLITQYGLSNHQVLQDLLIVLAALLLNTVMYALTFWRPHWQLYFEILAYTQIAFDLGIMTGAIFVNGGLETPISMLYCIPILMSGAILSWRSVYATGFAATLLTITFALLDFSGTLHSGSVAAPAIHMYAHYFVPTLVITVTILLTVTVIADFVGRLVRQRTEYAHELEAVNAEKAKTEAIIKTMGSALVSLDTKGRITMVNDNFEYLTGWRRDEALGKSLSEVLPMIDPYGKRVPDDERPAMQLSALGSHGNYHTRTVNHYSYIRKNGTSFPFISSLAPIVLNRQVIGLTNTFDDITEVQRLDQLKTNFVALVSHQLKTPIGEIMGYVNNMLYGVGGKLSSKQSAYLGEIRDVAERANKLITDLLDITILERGGLVLETQDIRLSPIIRDLLKVYEHRLQKKHLKVKVVKAEKELTVIADRDKLLEVLGNVLANAISYSKHGEITITATSTEDYAEVCISDKGSGMDPTTINAVFDKDQILSGAPTPEGGTGLGLYLARQLMRLQHGDVKVVSTSAKGTTICINIPLMKG